MQPIEYLKEKQACQYYIALRLNESNYSRDELITNVFNDMSSEYSVNEGEVSQLVTESVGPNPSEYYWDDPSCSIRYEIPNNIASELMYEEPKFVQLVSDGSVNYVEGNKVSEVYLSFIEPEDEELLNKKRLRKELRDERFPFQTGIKELPWHVDNTDFRAGIYYTDLFDLIRDPDYNSILTKGIKENFKRSQTSLFYFDKSNLTLDEVSLLDSNANIETEDASV